MLGTFKSIVQESEVRGSVTLVTHDGIFHADDLFCTALLELFFEKLGIKTKVIRTRSKSNIPVQSNLIIYDAFNSILDHHSDFGITTRPKKVGSVKEEETLDRQLASIGRLWRFGKEEFCTIFGLDERTWARLDKEIVAPIDITDNSGVMNPMTYFINCLRNTKGGEYKAWRPCLEFVKEVWRATIGDAQNLIEANKKMKDLPIYEVNGKRFKISDSFCSGYVEDFSIKGIIWKKETGTYGIKMFGHNTLTKKNIAEGEMEGIVYVHPSGRNGEVRELADFNKIV